MTSDRMPIDVPSDPAWRRRPSSSFAQRVALGLGGLVLARPWFDHVALAGLKRVYVPASRLWGAAGISGGDLARFHDNVPMPVRFETRETLADALCRFEQARVAKLAIEAAWQDVFFGPADASEETRVAMEDARVALAHDLNATRFRLWRIAGRGVPQATLDMETPAALEAVYGRERSVFLARSAPPSPLPAVEVSRTVPTDIGTDYWLRFRSPSSRLADTAYARVHEPSGAKDPPTIIFGHGVCVEFDHWKGLIDESDALVKRGFRVIRPEAPWHGRRAAPGTFGGERSIGKFPLGLLDSFSGAVQEWAVMADWARRTSSGALIFGGSSLGAMTAQLAAECSLDWPSAIRPDGLFLVTHTGDMADVILNGALSDVWAQPRDMAAMGWTPEVLRNALSYINPVRPLPLAGNRIVSILARRDRVLPFASGREQAERWAVPSANAFEWDCGHFSVPTRLKHTDTPLDRLVAIAAAARPSRLAAE